MESILSELIVTADVHEQANCKVKTRVLGLQKFVEELGGCFQEEHLGDGYGLDYKADGYYKGKEISLGVEYKVFLNDFVPNHGILEKRFGAAREHYDNIALVIEGESLAKTSHVIGDKNIWYVNPAVIDGSADQMMNRQMFEDRVQAWTESGVLVRNIKAEDDFPITFLYLLEYITKDEDWYTKHRINLPNASFKNRYINTLLSIEIEQKEGFRHLGYKTAQKVIKSYPNLYWLCTYSEDDLKDALGKVTGKKLYDFIHNNELITSEWQNRGSKAQLSKETEKAIKSNPEQSINNPELKYLDENKPIFIEVPKGSYVNGGKIYDINPPRDQEPEILQSSSATATKPNIHPIREENHGTLCTSTAHKDPESGKVANLSGSDLGTESQLSRDGVEVTKSDPIRDDQPKAILNSTLTSPPSAASSSDITRSLGLACEIPEPPDNSEFQANPRFKDVVEYIRRSPDGRNLNEVEKEFGFTKNYCFEALNKLWNMKKIWLNKATMRFEFGLDKNPMPVVADKEFEVM